MTDEVQIHGAVLYPAAAMIVMAIEAAQQMSKHLDGGNILGYSLKELTFHKSLTLLPGLDGVEVEFFLHPTRQASDRGISWSDFRLYVYENQEWAEVCRGCIRVDYSEPPAEIDEGVEFVEMKKFHKSTISDGRRRCFKSADVQSFYRVFHEMVRIFGFLISHYAILA